MKDIWEIGKLEHYKVICIQNEVRLHWIDPNQVIDQETYFAIEPQNNIWNTYVVQCGRRILCYTTPIYEFAQISACILFHRHFLRPHDNYDWSAIDNMIKNNLLDEAMQTMRRDIPTFSYNGRNEQIVLQRNGSSIEVVYCNNNERSFITAYPDYYRAFQVCRYFSLRLIQFQTVFYAFAAHFPNLDAEYDRLIRIFLRLTHDTR